uniref:Uncharacterized protein n=1 Tax=Arundo donax TaxID=35708 RepID=A0A0A9BKD1_ARUDO
MSFRTSTVRLVLYSFVALVNMLSSPYWYL